MYQRPLEEKNTRHFKFENAWLVEPEFVPFVEQRWQTYGNSCISQKLDKCADDLNRWDKENNQPIRKEIEKCRKKLKKARMQVCSRNINYFNVLRRRLDTLLVKDDIIWKQRAKTHWYKEGDLNTRYFHASATTRRSVNKILQLQDANGTVCNTIEGMHSIATKYFVDIFKEQNGERHQVLEAVATSITVEDNASLTRPFIIEEFKDAIFSISADKCPGPDWFNPGFYQKFWNVCGIEIFEVGCLWLEKGVFPTNLNSTNIALIPK